jgi:RNA 2',3'-cyclic 3'-phosphodiesterase
MSDANESWRLFVAIELPAKVRKRLSEHIGRLRILVPDERASWVPEENLHLTLKFLGDVTLTKVELVAQATQGAAELVESFELIVGGVGAFPPNGQPRVLWIGIEDPSGRLGLLHQQLEAACEEAGLAREQRPFHPHLTIARLRKPQGSRQLAIIHKELGFDRETVLASDLALIRSELQSDGARHTTVARHALSSAKTV